MKLAFSVLDQRWQADEQASVDATLAFDPTLSAGRAFGLRATSVEAVEIGGGRTLRVSEGAAVDCADIALNPHGGGTHVECVGHIVADRWTLSDVALPGMLAATLLDVGVETLQDSGEHAGGRGAPTDRVITARSLQQAFANVGEAGFDQAIAIRTDVATALPAHADWSGSNPPYPTAEAMRWLSSLPAQLLVLDLPSLDREDDGGTTPNHRAWWGLGDGARRLEGVRWRARLVVELARFPLQAVAGPWLLRVDVAPIASDAAPARVRLLPVTQIL